MHSVFIRLFSITFVVSIVLPLFLFSADSYSSGLPSQQSRFEGMGSTFKAKKQQSNSSSESELIEKQEEDSEAEGAETESSYFKLHTFVVNVVDKRAHGRLVFLTLEVYCEIRDANERWLIDKHLGPIKDTIITHISGLNREELQTQKQKKELQAYLSEKTKLLIKRLTGKAIINDLYLTRILIQ